MKTLSLYIFAYPFSLLFSWIRFLYYSVVSFWINFVFLPYRQAIKMPIWIESPHFPSLIRTLKTAEIVINSNEVKNKMIKLGVRYNSWNPYNGINLQLYGKIIFEGGAVIGNNSTLYVASGATLHFGKNFIAASALSVICQKKIMFGNDALIGWNCQFSDTDFHNLTDAITKSVYNRKAPILIGKNNWIGCHTKVFKGFKTNDDIVISAGSVCKKRAVIRKKSIIGNPDDIITLGENIYYDSSLDGTISS